MKKLYLITIKGKKEDRLIKEIGAGRSEYIEDMLNYAILNFKKENGEDIEIIDIRIKELAE